MNKVTCYLSDKENKEKTDNDGVRIHDINLAYIFHFRHANLGDVAAGYVADAGKCAPALFFRVLYFWHCGSSTVGGYTATAMRPGFACSRGRSKVSIIDGLKCGLKTFQWNFKGINYVGVSGLKEMQWELNATSILWCFYKRV